MKILAMDTAAQACSVALWQETAVTHHVFREMARGHASELLPMVDGLLQDVALEITDLDALAVTIGPGGFTGLRIGLAAARGFAAASGLPVIGVTTLEALAHGVGKQEGKILCALDAKRADLYAQLFDGQGYPLSEAVARLPEDVVMMVPADETSLIVAGDSWARLEPLFKEHGIHASESCIKLPDARDVVEIAAQKGIPAKGQDRPSALYIRPPDAALPKNGGRLRP